MVVLRTGAGVLVAILAILFPNPLWGEYGGAHVTILDCAVYDSDVAVRAEDRIENLKIRRLGLGDGVRRKLHAVGGQPGVGFENTGEHTPPPYAAILKSGLPP